MFLANDNVGEKKKKNNNAEKIKPCFDQMITLGAGKVCSMPFDNIGSEQGMF